MYINIHQSAGPNAAHNDEPQMEKPRLSLMPEGNNPFIGPADAPVTMLAFVDYDCPYCKLFIKDQLPLLMEKYVRKGALKIVFKDHPLERHAQAPQLAVVAHRYFQRKTFDAFLKNIIDPAFNAAQFINDEMAQFPADSMDNVYRSEMSSSKFLAGVAGITATPTFVVNNRILVGLRKPEELEALIDYSLKNAGSKPQVESPAGSCN